MNLTRAVNTRFENRPIEDVPLAATGHVNLLAYVHLRNIHRSTGAGRVARQLIERVAEREGIHMHVLADRGDYRAVIDRVGNPWTTFQYDFFERDTSPQQLRWALFHRPYAESYWPEAQVVHCTGESYVPTRRAREVVTLHDAAYFDQGAHPRNRATLKQQFKWRMLYAILSRKSDAFHTVSHFSAERLGKFFPAMRSRIHVIYNAVPERFFSGVNEAGEQFLDRLGLRARPYILLPGGLHYRKNSELVLKAWPLVRERSPELTLVVSGHCDPEHASRARALGPSLMMTGFVDDDELCSLYHGAQAVWFPSRYEGFGLPVVEAMACGTPVVASNTTSIPEIAADAALLIDPNSPSENVEALRALIADSRLCSRLRERGHERVRRFTWQAAATRMHELYSSLL